MSGAPTSAERYRRNKAVAARFGKTEVAICLPRTGSDGLPGIHVNGTLTPVDDGKTLALADGVAVARQGNLYQLTSKSGTGLRDGQSHLDRCQRRPGPVAYFGQMAFSPTPERKRESDRGVRDGFVLTCSPFNFNDLYHRFADNSWRVSAEILDAIGMQRGDPDRDRYSPADVLCLLDLEPRHSRESGGSLHNGGCESRAAP